MIKSAIRDVEALVCVFAIAIFMNALDKRTYMPFVQAGATLTPEEQKQHRKMDLNAIPFIERRHCCYTRGLAFDIMGWFYNRYKLQKEGMNPIDGYLQLTPVIARFGWHMVQYKRKAEEYGTVGVCTASAFERQVEMALFGFEGFEETYKEPVDGEDDQLRLPFRFWGYSVVESEPQHHYKAIDNYFKAGRNRADNKFFFVAKGWFF